jgi:hypothetical protein
MDAKNKVSVSKADVYKENPFINSAIERVKESTLTKRRFLHKNKGVESMIVSGDTGEIQGYSTFMQLIEVDEDKFAKLYLSQFAAFWDLDKSAIRVFGYILNVLLPNKDFVYIDLNEALEYTGYTTKKPIFAGLGQLIGQGIIARSSSPMKYFINPLMFFNGNRVTFARTYVRKKTKAIDDRQLSLFPDL